MFGRYKALKAKKVQNSAKFTPQDAKLEGYDMPLKTTLTKNSSMHLAVWRRAWAVITPGKAGI